VVDSAPTNLLAVWGNGSDAIFATGQKELVECDAFPCAAWPGVTNVASTPLPGFFGLGGVPGGYVYAVGVGATIWKSPLP
jgi:hypothetical protein